MVEIVFTPSAGPSWQVALATLPLFAVLIYFLVEAALRVGSNNNNGKDDAEDGLLPIRLMDMLLVYLVIAQLAAFLAVYITFFVPKRHLLLKKYLDEGGVLIGDVFYERKNRCEGYLHRGHVVYPHPMHDDGYPAYIRRSVRVFERFTRERVAIRYLPGLPYSGQSESDIRIDLLVAEKNKGKMRFLEWFSWSWVVFTTVAPFYIVMVMAKLDGDKNKAWIIYLLSIGLVIPVLSVLVNWVSWWNYNHFMARGDARVVDKDLQEYKPPSLEPLPSDIENSSAKDSLSGQSGGRNSRSAVPLT